MVLAFRREEDVQPVFPGFPTTVPDFSASAIRDVFVPVAGAIEADVYNTRSLQERERACRLIALKERVQALEHEVARWNDLIGYELNLMGKDS
jgi:hypothetical protein